ncbi:MAG: hypothetical protein RIB45_18030 [Marivibrio sp.]|uniref:hypothetical protein n=1 Tax=Marivibrio sp. TaxID=2039719 RepID=UPI0032EEC814
MSIGQELLNVPMGDMIRDMAFAIAEAQYALDENSVEVAEMMGGLKTIVNDEGETTFEDSRVFFGHEYMSVREAKATAAADDAVSGGGDVMSSIVGDIVSGRGDDEEVRVPTRVSMLELGFAPTFYQFVDTIIEVKIAIKITREREYSVTRSKTRTDKSRARKGGGVFGAIFGSKRSKRSSVSTSQVDAAYSSKYSYTAEGASLLRTKLSPVPPPPILEERIRGVMEQEEARREAKREDAPA